MRRLVIETPIRLASAARLVATFALYAVIIASLLLRLDIVGVVPGLAALSAGWGVALIAAFLAIGAFASIWRTGAPGGGRALVGLVIAVALLLPPAYFGVRAAVGPRINDVTTDMDDPPALAAARGERLADANPVAYDRRAGRLQKEAYPEIHPLIVDTAPEDVHAMILELVKERRWRIVADVPLSSPDTNERVPVRFPVGRLEAVATSLILGFEDDVVIRLREEDGRTRVDMRSASRYGAIDFGTNADRVVRFLEELRNRTLAPPQASS